MAHKAPIPDLREWSEKIGAVTPPASWSYSVQTRVGTLLFTPYEGWIACRFENVERAREHFGGGHARFNAHNGKWNWHAHPNPESVELMIQQFQRAVEELLPEPTASEPTSP